MLFSGSIQIAGHNYMKIRNSDGGIKLKHVIVTNPIPKKVRVVSAQGHCQEGKAPGLDRRLTYPRGNLARTSTRPY